MCFSSTFARTDMQPLLGHRNLWEAELSLLGNSEQREQHGLVYE